MCVCHNDKVRGHWTGASCDQCMLGWRAPTCTECDTGTEQVVCVSCLINLRISSLLNLLVVLFNYFD